MGAHGSLDAVFAPGNLKRAWRWITSSPDRLYRGICQPAYSDYSQHIDQILVVIADTGRRRFYEASSVRRIELPKSHTLSRPYSILSVADQIVYQAIINLVAERLHERVKHRHFVSTFSHIYAGRTSPTLYRRWQAARQEYVQRARRVVLGGLRVTATFDIAACYDTIGHSVIDRSLQSIGFESEFRDLLRRCLATWTTTTAGGRSLDIGIPQGPLGSGTLAELVLEAFDIHAENKVEALEYFRYVDDIRLFGSDPHLLQERIWELEKIARSLGMSAQQSKVDVHAVTDVNAELKSVSFPAEVWKTRECGGPLG